MLENYQFYPAILRFVAKKTDKSDVKLMTMMGELEQIAHQLDQATTFSVLASRAQVSARAFAGVASFLSQRILPEAQAAENKDAVEQLSWAVEASLQIGRALLLHIEGLSVEEINQKVIEIKLPPLDLLNKNTVH